MCGIEDTAQHSTVQYSMAVRTPFRLLGDGAQGGRDALCSTLHWRSTSHDYYYDTYFYQQFQGLDFSNQTMTFGLFWNESIIYTYVDTTNNHDDSFHVMAVQFDQPLHWVQFQFSSRLKFS